jgi:hypothetical protein
MPLERVDIRRLEGAAVSRASGDEGPGSLSEVAGASSDVASARGVYDGEAVRKRDCLDARGVASLGVVARLVVRLRLDADRVEGPAGGGGRGLGKPASELIVNGGSSEAKRVAS